MMNLPEEVIVEILLRLPVKSLIRFKCVSRIWQSLISDPHFGKLHLERASTSTDRILFSSPNQFLSIDLNSSLHDDSSVVSYDFPSPTPPDCVQIMGSCRGFLLLALDDDERLFIWNPSTNACKSIPPSPIELVVFFYGFGYDPLSDDFLVVQLSTDLEVVDTVGHFEIFSVRTNSWKKLEFEENFTFTYTTLQDPGDSTRAGLLLNGAIHWLALRVGDQFMYVAIIALDLSSKNLREVPVPYYLGEPYLLNIEFYDLAVFGGCLGLIDMNRADMIGIWLMKEYGVKSSWTKSIDLYLGHIPSIYFLPICCTKSGEVIAIESSVKLVKYNGEGRLLEDREFCHESYVASASAFAESILSLPGCDGEEEERH